MIEPDVIADILSRIREVVEVPEQTIKQIERDARQYWGGERCYVAKAGESPRRREAFERAESIRADFRRGERVEFLARRYVLSPRHVRRILGLFEAALATPAANDASARRPLPTRTSRRRAKADTTLP
jgi:Mor family transcriptional regulator